MGVPLLIQKTAKPLMSGSGNGDLVCECGQTLIAGYQSRQYIEVGFKCFQCAKVTLSDEWPEGEPLPRHLIIFPVRDLPMGSTATVPEFHAVASEEAVIRIKKATAIRKSDSYPMDLGSDALDATEIKYDKLSSGEMLRASHSARRAASRNNTLFLRSHLAWALEYIRACNAAGTINLDDEKAQAALTFLQISRQLLTRWEHHSCFPLISKSIVLEFPHTVTQLLAASYLADAGNDIGFNDHIKFSGRSPDMFINANFKETISLEVKAPEELQWPSKCPEPFALENLLIKQIKNASKQITGELGGVVVIGATWAGQEEHGALVRALKNIDMRNKISSRVAGVVGVFINILGHYWDPAGHGIRSDLVSNVHVQLNSRFKGEQFLSLESGAS